MSIQGIVGKPGAGKSYQAVQRAHDGVSSGRVVVTNLPLNMDAPFWQQAKLDGLLFQVLPTSKAEASDHNHLGAWAMWEALSDGADERFYREIEEKDGARRVGPLVIVDEAANTFSRMLRERKKPANRKSVDDAPGASEWESFLEFCRVHRHYLIDVVLMYQSHTQCQHELKALIDTFWVVDNQSAKTGVPSWRMLASSRGFGVTVSNATDKKEGLFRKEIFELYDSYSEGAASGAKGKQSTKGMFKVRPVWARPMVILAMIAIVAMPFLIWMFVGRAKSLMGGKDQTETAQVFAQSPKAEPVAGELTAVESSPVIAPVNALAFADGLPVSGSVFIGFTRDEIFFDGHRVRRLIDLDAKGWRVVVAEQCLIVVLQVDNPAEFREFTCKEGF